MTRLAGLMVLVWLFERTSVRPAWADTTCIAVSACAQLAESAKRKAASSDFEGALRDIDGAYALVADPFLLVNRGRTLHHLGRYAEAASAYQRFRARVPNPMPDHLATVRRFEDEAQAAIRRVSPPAPVMPASQYLVPAPTPTIHSGVAGDSALARSQPGPSTLRRLWWIWPVAGAVTGGVAVGLIVGLKTREDGDTGQRNCQQIYCVPRWQ